MMEVQALECCNSIHLVSIPRTQLFKSHGPKLTKWSLTWKHSHIIEEAGVLLLWDHTGKEHGSFLKQLETVWICHAIQNIDLSAEWKIPVYVNPELSFQGPGVILQNVPKASGQTFFFTKLRAFKVPIRDLRYPLQNEYDEKEMKPPLFVSSLRLCVGAAVQCCDFVA